MAAIMDTGTGGTDWISFDELSDIEGVVFMESPMRFIESPKPKPEPEVNQINYYPEQRRGKGKSRRY